MLLIFSAYAFVFVFGAAIGSFLNVCIFRLPANASIVRPLSQCPQCHSPIRFYDNIPLVSYLILQGKCRDCQGKISWRYPLVEFITALLAVLLFAKFHLTLNFLIYFIFTAVLIVITFIDLDHQIIPDVLTLPGIPVFFLLAVFVVQIPWMEAAIGLLIGGGVLLAIALAYEFITKREGMGGGDIKLLAMIGGFLGWKSLIFILLFSSLLGAVVGITAMVIKKQDMKYAVPFGPFLSAAAVAYLFWGDAFMEFLLIRGG
ncbi:MAG: prepilin peptidase [Deltaproteobacteria bacterium HGW-Deltaproteobacteria-12]|jgi:leader peptidase (prepilin peptidase)/N-methyltransferase|nr:MAG: prepilin peptidase [Deltaproteobacteria bacterium HGW-Deltaproteobacteria-12]